MHIRRVARVAIALAAVALFAGACATTDDSGGGGGGGGEKVIALLLPETKTARYEAADRPLFEAKVKALCSDCRIIYSNADQKADEQQNQADAALTNGAKVMVLDPVDSASAASIVSKAKEDGKSSGNLVMINGAPTDNNAKLFKEGAHSVLDGSGFKFGKEYDTPDWSPNKAQDEMDQAITALGK